MADPLKILTDPDYVNANLATKQAIFNKHVASTNDYKSANAATKAAIETRFGLQAAAPATIGEDIVSGFQAPFKKLGETVSANYERRQKQTTYPKNLGDFVSRSIQDVAGTAQMVGDVANLATAPLQAITRPIAGQIAQLPLQAYSPATVSIDKKGVRFNSQMPLNYEQTKAQTETGLLTALSAGMPGAGQIARVAQTASIGASPQARAALSGMARRPVPRTAAPVVAAPEAAVVPPTPSQLNTPRIPTVQEMNRFSSVQNVDLASARRGQEVFDFAGNKQGKYSAPLIKGYGDLPVGVRLENGEVVIFDGNHRVALALGEGKSSIPMNVIEARNFDPENMGRKPSGLPGGMSTDELLAELGGAPTAPEAGRVFQAGERFGAKGSVGAASLEEAAIREQRAAELPIPIELAPFQKSRSFADQQRARELAKNGEVGGPIRDKLAEQQDILRQNFENFVEGTGSNVWVDPYAKGVILDGALSKLAKTEKTRIKSLYIKAGEAGELREPVPYASVLEFIDGQTPTTRNTLAPILSDIKEELIQNDPTGSGVISLGALEDIRKSINQKVQFGTPNANYGGELKRIIDEATANSGGDVYKQARAARVKYREDFEDIGLVREIIGTKKNSADRVVAYENLVNRIISPGTPFDSLKHVKDLMYQAGPDGEQAWRELQGATYEHIRDQAYKGITPDETGGVIISPAALNTAIRNLESGGKMDLILGKQGAELMRTVNALTQDLFTAPPGSVNYSGTSSAILNALDKMGMMALSKAPVVGPVVGTIRSALDKELTKLEVQKLIKTDRPAQPSLTQEPPQ